MLRPVVILGAMAVLLSACLAPKLIKQEHRLFAETVANNPAISRKQLQIGDDTLFYGAAGNPQKPTLIIMHGTPGSWRQYARYMNNRSLLKDFYVVVIDRPGWGRSSLSGGRFIATFREQAVLISALAEQLKQANQRQPVIIMGHSLGASIAPRVAIDHPHTIDGLLLLAGTLDPQLAGPRWFNHAAKWPIVNRLIDDRMQQSNQEIFALRGEMISISSQLSSLNAYTLVIQGMKDKLVYPENADYAKQAFSLDKTEVITLAEEGHLFPMTRREDIVRWSRCLLQKIQAHDGLLKHPPKIPSNSRLCR